MTFFGVHAGTIGLVFFFGFFLALTAWVFRPGTKVRYQHYAQLPLDEGK
jgi:cbb3-type cytochrome oxidase subunit 3